MDHLGSFFTMRGSVRLTFGDSGSGLLMKTCRETSQKDRANLVLQLKPRAKVVTQSTMWRKCSPPEIETVSIQLREGRMYVHVTRTGDQGIIGTVCRSTRWPRSYQSYTDATACGAGCQESWGVGKTFTRLG